MTWTCGKCGQTALLTAFYAKRADGVFDYACPHCHTADHDALRIPRINLKQPDGSIKFFYIPTPKQCQLHWSDARNLLWGGRAGTGKSHALRMDAYMRCMMVPGYRVLLLRRQFTELQDTHLDKAEYEAEQLTGDPHSWKASKYTVVFPNRSRLRFGHCETDADVKQYLSSEFDCIMYDEGSTFSEYSVRFINSRLRTTKPGVIPIVRVGSNPGAEWLYRYYIAKDITLDEDPSYHVDDYEFIPAEITDNPHVNLEEQQRVLNALPTEQLRRMYRDGDWLAVEGQFFGDFQPIHREKGTPWHVITELPTINGTPVDQIPWLDLVRSLDWGYDPDEGVMGWWLLLPRRYILIKEWTFKLLVTQKAAAQAKERTPAGHKVRYTVAGHDCWMKSRDTGQSIAETFARAGVPLRLADTDRVNGWQRVHDMLDDVVADGNDEPAPLIQIYGPACPGIVRMLPRAQADPKNPGDILQQRDHWADMVRYFAMSRPSPSRRAKEHGREEWKKFAPEVQRALMGQGHGKMKRPNYFVGGGPR